MFPMPATVADLLYAITIYFLALSGLVSVWATVCRAAWWWRIGPLLLLLMGLASADAGDLVWFAMVRAAVALAPVSLLRVWRWAKSRESAKSQFSVRDLFRATAVFAIVVSILVQLSRQRLVVPAQWAQLGLCCGLLDLGIVWLLLRERIRWYWLACVAALLAIATPAIEQHVAKPLIHQHRGLDLWESVFLHVNRGFDVLYLDSHPTTHIALRHQLRNVGLANLFPAMLFVLFGGMAIRMIHAGQLAARRSPKKGEAPTTLPAANQWRPQIAFALSSLAIVVAFAPGAMVWQLMPPPVERLEPVRTGENHFYEIAALGRSITVLSNAHARELMESRAVEAIPPQELDSFIRVNEQTFRDFHELVWRPSWMPLEESDFLPANDLLIALKRNLPVYVEGLLREGRAAEATEAILDQIRFGSVCGYSHFVGFEYIARWIEIEGLNNAARHLDDIPLEAIPNWLEKLRALESDRLDAPSIRRLDQDATRYHFTWAWRIQEAVYLLIGIGGVDLIDPVPETFVPRNVALIRLLRCELAIRAFAARHGRKPNALSELVPEWLPDVPDDPFGAGQLIYRPNDEGYVLYSVGPNRRDDGGQRVEVSKLPERGDLFVDSHVEHHEATD